MATTLIVDDEQRYRTNCREDFEARGWTALSARNGGEAIEILEQRSHQIDGIVLDLSMPGVSGDQVLRWLYDHQLLDDICVVVLTAYGNLDNAIDAFRMGVWQYLKKPLSPPDILSFLAPGIALKKCHKMRKELLVADTLEIVLDRLKTVIRETLAPDFFHVIFMSTHLAIDLSDGSTPPSNRKFVRSILAGTPFIFASDRDAVQSIEPVLPDAACLMAVPVRSDHNRTIGVLDMESKKEKGFDLRWQEVLLYMADLIGLSQTMTESYRRQVAAEQLILVYRELGHRLATSVNISRQQAIELARDLQQIEIVSPALRRFSIIDKHLSNIQSVMEELRRTANQPAKLDIRLVDVNVSELIKRVVDEFLEAATSADIDLTIGPLESEWAIHTDPTWLEYCLECLLQNSIEAVQDRRSQDKSAKDERQWARVNCLLEDSWLKIEVQDSGIGFNEEIQKRLFVPLFSTKIRPDVAKNDGIGLYTAKRVVTELGGSLEASSDGDFKGATFTIILPGR